MLDMLDVIWKYVLDNSVRFEGKPNVKAIIGSLLGNVPSLRQNIKALNVEVAKVVKVVSSMSLDEQKRKLAELGGGLERKKEVKTEREIPSLQGDTTNVVMRFAPNPNGPIHFGHCRQALWNWFFVRKYNGKYILRFDDTDAKLKVPMKEAYDWFLEDLKWLGIVPDDVYKQSARLDKYYHYAEELIKKGGAYICLCDTEDWRKLVRNKKRCRCRTLTIEEHLVRWKKMFDEYKEGVAVYRVKTDLSAPNPAVRDWAGFRIVDESKHPYSKAKVWPLLNFASAIDDHLLGVTHILRGVDLKTSDDRQKYLYNYFGWVYPESRYSGKFLVSGIKSTSDAKKLIDANELIGWDDSRLGTIRALKRKGFCSEAIVKFIREVGIRKSDLNVSLEKLAAFNKDYLDPIANRYFFIKNPVKIKVEGLEPFEIELDLHPDKKGGRKFKVDSDFFIEKEDLDDWKVGSVVRLMDCVNVERLSDRFKLHSKVYDKKSKIIHWVSKGYNINVMIDGSLIEGLVEDNFDCSEDEVVQFVRFGFVRVDKARKEVWFAHK